jgi:hypothetical protein
MRILLGAYIILYAIFCVAILSAKFFVLPREERIDDNVWQTPLDVSLLLVGLVGMVLLALRYDSANMKTAWKFISVALAVGQIALNMHDRAKHLRNSAEVVGAHVRLADLGVLLFLMPSLGLNLAYAFGR